MKELFKNGWGVINNGSGLTPEWSIQFGLEYAMCQRFGEPPNTRPGRTVASVRGALAVI